MKQENFTDEELLQLQPYTTETISYAQKALTKALHSGKSIPNQFSYLIGICKNRKAEQASGGPKAGSSRPYNKQEAPRRHIDQAQLQPLSEAAKQKRAQERRDEWNSRRGKKENDSFYVPTQPTAPIDNTDLWYTPAWCQERLIEDEKILEAAKTVDPNNDFVRYSLFVVQERVFKCKAILAARTAISEEPPKLKQVQEQPRQVSLFDEDDYNGLDYNALDEIL